MAREGVDRGRPSHPSRSAQTESKLAYRQIDFVFEPNLNVGVVSDVEGNQVRLTEHRAPKSSVDRYAEQMRAGATFPAIVVNGCHEIVDGNTRWMAAKRNKKEKIAAYVCHGLTALEARSLSVELNQSNGLAMTEDEIRAFVTSAVDEGLVLDAKAYSRMTGTRTSTLNRWVAVKHFEMRASRHAMTSDDYGCLPDSTRAALQVAKLSSVFVQATALAIDARVPVAELRSIITEANAATSEVGSLTVVAQARADRAEEIKLIASGFKRTRRRGVGSALHIGGLLRFGVDDLLDVPKEKRPETYERMSCLKERLDGALARAREEWEVADFASVDAPNDPGRIDVLTSTN